MADGRTERRLAAILAADVVGYSRMIAADEAATLRQFKACVSEALEPLAHEHGGRIVKTMGDGVLVEFSSAVEALLCASAFQRAMAARNAHLPSPQRVEFRVGIHDGDVVHEDGDVFGEVVAVAARLEGLAEPGGVCVSARVREDAEGRADFGFEDLGEQRLKNVARPVRAFRVKLEAQLRPHLALPDKPSIAVLPFENMSGDKGQEYFADGVSEDIITALSRWRWFFVIARNSSFIYKGRSVDVTQVGRELGVRYVLEGSVRRDGARVRVVAQLIDAATGVHIWADTFDRDLTDLFALHDEITEHVVGAIEPAMLHSEGERAAHKSAADLSAFDCFQRGMWHLNRITVEDFRAARELFTEATRRDPGLSLGYTGLARILYGSALRRWSADPRLDLLEAENLARTAIKLDARDAWAHFALSGALLYLGRHEDALETALRAVALNTNFAFGHFRHGQVLTCIGRAGEGVEPIARSIRYSPFDPQMGSMLGALSLAHYHAGDFETAAARAQESVYLGFAHGALALAASLARLDRVAAARAALEPPERAGELAAGLFIPYARNADYEDFLGALRLAGLRAPLAGDLDDLRSPIGRA
ncbi:MAG: adenylate/guanylate cyclase domain-containing protein [Caulobacteraceae bacterium]